jgi:hypothetical protein
MQINVAYIDSTQRFLLKSMDTEHPSAERDLKSIDLTLLAEHQYDLVLYKSEELYQEIENELQKLERHLPLVNSEKLKLNKDHFEHISASDLQKIYLGTYQKWIMHNNLLSIESLVQTLDHLKKLYNQDRDGFFEELWYFLQSNLSNKGLKLIFSNVEEEYFQKAHKRKKDQQEGRVRLDFDKLIYSKVYGEHSPQTTEATSGEAILMNEFQNEFNQEFTVLENKPEKQKLVIATSIKNSPVMILSESSFFNPLQESLLKALFKNLNR